MCRKCLEYGHSVKYCRGNLSCARCGRANHEADECQESQKSCFHCDEDHYAESKVCKERKKEEEILCIQKKEWVSHGQATHIFNRINLNYGMNYSNAVNRAPTTPRKNKPRPSLLSNPAHQEAPEQSAVTDNTEEMEAETMIKRKRADDSHEDQRDERATGNKKKPTEVVCMRPETGTIFTTVVNLKLSAEQ